MDEIFDSSEFYDNDEDFLQTRNTNVEIEIIETDENTIYFEDNMVNIVVYNKLYIKTLTISSISSIIFAFLILICRMVLINKEEESICQNGYFVLSLSGFILMLLTSVFLFFICTVVNNIMKKNFCLQYDLTVKYLFFTFLLFLISLSFTCGGLYWTFNSKIINICGKYSFFIFLRYLFIFQTTLNVLLIFITIFVLSNIQKTNIIIPVLEENSICLEILPEKYKNDTCSICLINFNYNNQMNFIQLNCEHIYHKVCIDKWIFEGNLNCPICRNQIS